MKKLSLAILISSLLSINTANAAGLMDVYQDALQNDQTYKEAEATLLQNNELLPQARAALLPNITTTAQASENWASTHGSGDYAGSGDSRYRSYGYTLQATQALFNWGAFAAYRVAKASVNQAAATFEAAQQDLIYRVAQAYFNVLQAEEVLRYAQAQQTALESQADVAKQRYEVGLDPITSLYQAQAAYDAAHANYIAKQNAFSSSQEDLRVITSKSYSILNRLEYDFPLVTPNPTDIDEWTKASIEQNFALKAARYGTLAAQDTIRVQEGNRLPTANLVGNLSQTENSIDQNGSGTRDNLEGSLGVALSFSPYTGGLASSNVRQAQATYQLSVATMEQTYRQTVATTRKDYLSVLAGISQVQADRQAIKSNLSALTSTEAGYKVGTQTINDVLQQQQSLYQAQTNYAQDRFTYLLTSLQLKQDAGTLSVEDLAAIDQWLSASTQSVNVAVPTQVAPTKMVKKQHKLPK